MHACLYLKGFKTFGDMVGRADKLKQNTKDMNYKEASLNYDSILLNAQTLRSDVCIRGGSVKQDFGMEKRLDMKVIEQARGVLEGREERIDLEMKITNEDRTFGATLSNEISLRYREVGLKDDSIKIKLSGHAGQSFGAFLGKRFKDLF